MLSAGATSAPQTTTFTSDPQVSAQYNLYGNSLIAQGLNNFPVGTGSATVGTCGATNGVSVYTFPYLGIKFTLPASFGTKTLVGITKYFYGGLSTYSWGTGGQYAWTIYSDNAGVPNTSAAAIGGPSSTLSAGSPSNPQGVSGNVWSLQTFSPGVTLVGGTTYHLVTHNTDADPTHNCTSSDDIYFLNVPPRSPTGAVPTSQFVLETSNTGTSGWTDQTNGNGTYPAFDLRFSDASHYGYSYTELNGSTPNGYNNLVGGVNQTQQTFTVGGSSMTVSSLYVAAGLRSGGGTGLMTATVKQGGTTVATLIGSAIAAAAQSNANQHWINFPISPSITLTSGTAYTVTFTAASGTTYDMYAMRRAINSANYCVVPACGIGSYFHDGTAFFSTNSGGSFSNWGSSGADTDLFFFFQ